MDERQRLERRRERQLQRERQLRRYRIIGIAGALSVVLLIALIVVFVNMGAGNDQAVKDGTNTQEKRQDEGQDQGQESEKQEPVSETPDVTAPQIAIKGKETITIELGDEFKDEGCSASDDRDGDLTANIVTEGTVDVSRAGTYELTYTVKDAAGNESKVTRKVTVTDSLANDPKTVYLTFDDGPGPYTEKLLDILDKYEDVKVTFFVTNQFEKYHDLIRREYESGHTIGNHTYSHDYAKIYSSKEAFYEDINKMGDIVFEQTGVRPTIIRFPGGSSNTISRHYGDGIMTTLAKALEADGFQYADWNVVSGDAGETTETERVKKYVINGIKNNSQGAAVILQHDIKEFSVNAVEDIIKWGLENGYRFRAMSDTSPMAHQGINN